MTQPLVSCRREGPVAVVGLNRADKRNAINEPVIAALHGHGLFMAYLASSMQRPPEATQRLRELVEGRAKPLVVTAAATPSAPPSEPDDKGAP